jgi:hypothetical protein
MSLFPKSTRKRIPLGLSVLIVVVALVVLFSGAIERGESASLALADVTPTQLARVGLILRPTTAPAAITAAKAEAVALHQMGAQRSLQTVLANCQTTESFPRLNRPCYVVVLDPSGRESAGSIQSPVEMTWSLALVDPNTGEFIHGFEGSGP